MNIEPAHRDRMVWLLSTLAPLFREASMLTLRGWTRRKFHDPVTHDIRGGAFAAIVDAASGTKLPPGEAIAAFNAFAKALPAEWCEWDKDRVAAALNRAAASAEAQLEAGI